LEEDRDEQTSPNFLPAGLGIALGGSVLAAGQSKVPDGTPRASAHQRGLAHFARGFYEFLPQNRSAEAAGEFEAAVRSSRRP